MKSGRLSKEEWDYIRLNYQQFSYEEMAAKLDRSVDSIRTFVEKKLGKNVVTVADREERAEYDIKRRAYWPEIEKQFNKEELEMFLFHWKRIISQFKDDVFPTEEVQVVDSIKIDILMNRLLSQQQQDMNSIASFEGTLSAEKRKDDAIRDVDLIIRLEDQIATLRAAQESISREYRELLDEKNKLYKELKATRALRIKELENSHQSMLGWIKEVLNNTELRKNLGLNMEKMRLGMEQERKRLTELHQYENKELDIPFLTPEVVERMEDE